MEEFLCNLLRTSRGSGDSNLSCQGPGLPWERKIFEWKQSKLLWGVYKIHTFRVSPGALWWMCLQAHDASVPFGNFWKAVIFGIINLECFLFFFLTTGFGKECNKMLLTYVVLWEHLIVFCFVLFQLHSLGKTKLIWTLERQRKKRSRSFVDMLFTTWCWVCLSCYSGF